MMSNKCTIQWFSFDFTTRAQDIDKIFFIMKIILDVKFHETLKTQLKWSSCIRRYNLKGCILIPIQSKEDQLRFLWYNVLWSIFEQQPKIINLP